jgi:hypothetical protein
VVLSLAAEVGEGMLRLPEAEVKKRAPVISENKIAKQERKRHHGRIDGIDRTLCSLGTQERKRRNRKTEESRNGVLTWTPCMCRKIDLLMWSNMRQEN